MVTVSTVTPNEPAALVTSIGLPYKLTTGVAAGTFLAELSNKRLLGSRCSSCERVLVPAQDFCAPCRTATEGFVEVSPDGSIVGFTETEAGVLALVHLKGADSSLVHRVLDTAYDDLAIGKSVTAVWADEVNGGMLDLAGFRLVGDDEELSTAEAEPFAGSEDDRMKEMPYQLDLNYEHAYGPLYGRMFDELATSRRILGVRCPTCESVLLPPREFCDRCFVRTGGWVDVADTGVLKAFSIIHLEFKGQVKPPPYVYAEIVLDGASTKLIHIVGGVDIKQAKDTLRPGMRVRAVWRDGHPQGTLADIEHFEIIEDEQ